MLQRLKSSKLDSNHHWRWLRRDCHHCLPELNPSRARSKGLHLLSRHSCMRRLAIQMMPTSIIAVPWSCSEQSCVAAGSVASDPADGIGNRSIRSTRSVLAPVLTIRQEAAADQGQVVLLYEQRLIDPVQEFYLPLPIATSEGISELLRLPCPGLAPRTIR